MANYYATARTSYFKVKDEDKFKGWAKSLGLDVWEATEKDPHKEKLFALGQSEHETGFVSVYVEPLDSVGDETDNHDYEDNMVDVLHDLQKHLEEGWAAIYVEAGAEKQRYVIGTATVVTNKETKTIEINDWATNWCKDRNYKHTEAEF
ncbi:MAG: hypothetical protein H8E12_17075 [Rhodobacteraceae bacterium]|nr:hypothetical protein [Paracoccaceae bacterium]